MIESSSFSMILGLKVETIELMLIVMSESNSSRELKNYSPWMMFSENLTLEASLDSLSKMQMLSKTFFFYDGLFYSSLASAILFA
jgi:hypothetical protein